MKYISNDDRVDMDKSRMVRDWGKGAAKVELWADEGNAHVWLETNGDPVSSRDGIIDLLIECGVDRAAAERIADGNIDLGDIF
jgi:hypothetical protein